MLIRIDDVVSGMKKKKENKSGMATAEGPGGMGEQGETFGDARDGWFFLIIHCTMLIHGCN